MRSSTPRRRFVTWLALTLLLAGLILPGSGLANGTLTEHAVGTTTDGETGSGDETSDRWLVELSSDALAEVDETMTESEKEDYLLKLNTEQDQLLSSLTSAGISHEVIYRFTNLWNGISIKVSREQVPTISRFSGVKAVWPVVMVTPDLFTSTDMIGAPAARSNFGVDGTGVKVAVMDTGIDYTHPDLGGCFGDGCRVAKGYDFVGNDFDASNPAKRTPQPDSDPMDCHGHGTHVAGIIGAKAAGSEGVTGVAPGVTLYAYKVFGCAGSTTSDVMIAAMERLLSDGAQVLNMSIGAAFQWPQYPSGRAASNLVKKGVVVVASAGNSGGSGQWSLSAPSVGERVISVASVDNSSLRLRSFALDDGLKIGYIAMQGAPPPPETGTLVFGLAKNLGCDPGDFFDGAVSRVLGKAALISRGVCTFQQKVANAQAAGALSVVVHNNVDGYFAGLAAGSIVPTVGTSRHEGMLIRERMEQGPVSMTWQPGLQAVPNPTGNTISSFSSIGLSPTLDFKPDVAAPGGAIYSTYPVAKNSYATLSGTSMAAPHTAGAAALLLAARPGVKAQEVRTVLQNSAVPLGMVNIPGPSPVTWQGAGQVNIHDALRSPLSVSPSKLVLGELAGGSAVKHTLTVTNNSSQTITYSVSALSANSFGVSKHPPLSAFSGTAHPVTLSATSVTVQPGGTASVDATITADPALPDGVTFGGWVVLTPSDTSLPTVRVPFAGFKGDYQSVPVLTGVKSLAVLENNTWTPVSSVTQSYGSVNVNFMVHLDHQVTKLQLSAQSSSGKTYERVLKYAYVGRNSTSNGFFVLAYDGKDRYGENLPKGTYTLTLSVLKAMGDDATAAHWERADLGTLTIGD